MEEKQLDDIVEDLHKICKKTREIQDFASDIASKVDELRKEDE